MPLSLQVKLLRTTETREVMPVGAVKARAIDVRFIAATNRDLDGDAMRETFRRDLFFRPERHHPAHSPLRERTNEIEALVETFIDEGLPRFRSRACAALRARGNEPPAHLSVARNIREPRNVVERALVLCDGPEITSEYLPLDKVRTVAASNGTEQKQRPGDANGYPTARGRVPAPSLPELPGLSEPDSPPELDDSQSKRNERADYRRAERTRAWNLNRARPRR